MLSVLRCSELVCTDLVEEIQAAYARDKQCSQLLKEGESSSSLPRNDFLVEGGMIYKHRGIIFIPDDRALKTKLFHLVHDSNVGGHLGISKTYRKLGQHFYWANMKADVTEYVTSCANCARSKHRNTVPTGLLQPIPIPEGKWECWTMDLVGPLPLIGKGHDGIVVFVDKFTKLCHMVPIVMTITAVQLAEVMFNVVVVNHGVPKNIISDRDPRFTAHVWEALWTLMNTKLSMSTAYHPQSDGQTERMNRTMEEMLRSYVNERGDDWDIHLPSCEFAYNTSVQASTGFSPFRLSYGIDARSPIDAALSTLPPIVRIPAASDLVERWKDVTCLMLWCL